MDGLRKWNSWQNAKTEAKPIAKRGDFVWIREIDCEKDSCQRNQSSLDTCTAIFTTANNSSCWNICSARKETTYNTPLHLPVPSPLPPFRLVQSRSTPMTRQKNLLANTEHTRLLGLIGYISHLVFVAPSVTNKPSRATQRPSKPYPNQYSPNLTRVIELQILSSTRRPIKFSFRFLDEPHYLRVYHLECTVSN